MKYGKLGTSELTVSRICMGCMGFGEAGSGQHSWTVGESISREIIKKGWRLESIFSIRQSPIKTERANSILAAPCGILQSATR